MRELHTYGFSGWNTFWGEDYCDHLSQPHVMHPSGSVKPGQDTRGQKCWCHACFADYWWLGWYSIDTHPFELLHPRYQEAGQQKEPHNLQHLLIQISSRHSPAFPANAQYRSNKDNPPLNTTKPWADPRPLPNTGLHVTVAILPSWNAPKRNRHALAART